MTGSGAYAMSDGKDGKGGGKLKRLCCAQLFTVIIFAIGLVGGILIGIYAYHGGPDEDHVTVNCQAPQNPDPTSAAQSGATKAAQPTPKKSQETPPGECPNPNPVKDGNYEDTVYGPLTMKEMNKVAKWLFDNKKVTTLKAPKGLHENFILYQELRPPVKKEALLYLDQGGPKPKRYAKVTVQRGNETRPDVMEYKVGPLDSTLMTTTPLLQPGEVHFNSRPYESLENGHIIQILRQSIDVLAPLISESFDGATFEKDLYINYFNGPPSTTGTDRASRWNIGFAGLPMVEDIDLFHILPVSGLIHHSGTDPSTWYADSFHYLNQGPFNTAQDLMHAYNNDTIRKVKVFPGYRDTIFDRIFPKRDTSKPLRVNAGKEGPRAYNPEGPRYTIKGTDVKWMDWEFSVSGNQIRGPAIFDIKFKGERIIYEHAVNEIALNYAMDSHSQHNIIYADATYGILGGYFTTIMKGVDCPAHGTVMNVSYWWHPDQTAGDMRVYCIFEADAQEALWRHVGVSFEAGLRNRYLVVRAPVVVGNYDYTFEFHFYLDGKVYTKAMASGYIHSSFWDPGNPHTDDSTRDAFGYRLSDYQTGPVHDHIFGFKVDMDIIDKNNTFQVIKWKTGPAVDALNTQKKIDKAPPYFLYNETHYVEWERKERELGLQDTPEQQFWLMVNEREKNKWGVERGYQIVPLTADHQALKTHPLLKALSFTKYKCAVTKRKEEEPTLTSIYDINRMENAKKYLDSFIDDEYIVDDDLVTWIAVGFLHIPTSEDMPMTVRVETGFLVRPFNFFDRTISYDMPQHTETSDRTLTESEPKHTEPCAEPEIEYCRFC